MAKFISGTTYQDEFFGKLKYYTYCVYCGGDIVVANPQWEMVICPNPLCRKDNYNTRDHKKAAEHSVHPTRKSAAQKSKSKPKKFAKSARG